MATFKDVEDWYEDNKNLVKKYTVDEEGILTTDNGKKKGVYLISVKLVDEDVLIPMYAGEAGADDKHERSIADRLKEHLKNWLGGDTEYWTGVKKTELETEKMKFHLHIVGESKKLETRKKMEEYIILSEHPYLQYGPYEKYRSKYEGIDLCIIPWNGTRREAFLARLEDKGLLPIVESKLITNVFDKSFNPDWDKCMKSGKEKEHVACILRQELKKGTEEYKQVKSIVDRALGFKEGSRGCTYPYIVRILSHALEEYCPRKVLA